MNRTLDLCTYFDHRYLARGLALYESLRRHGAPFRLWVLCMTDECHRALLALALPEIVAVPLSMLEEGNPELLQAKEDRSVIEYYFTCTPVLISWLFATEPNIDVMTYVDADLYFFSDPRFLLEGFKNYSTLIIPHRFSERNAARSQWGTYNVGWLSFRRDKDGIACLGWWRRSCLAWCHDFIDGDRFADQKYLDQFPVKFARVWIVDHPGVNLAPWNLDRHVLTRDGNGSLLVDGQPLVFFHFHGLRRVSSFLWQTSHPPYGAPLDRRIRDWLYRPYLEALKAAEKRIDRNSMDAPPIERNPEHNCTTTLRAQMKQIRNALAGGGVIFEWW